MLKPSHNDIIPLEIQHELLAIRASATNQCFRIGDIASLLVANFATGATPLYEIAEVQASVAYFVGKSARSVRFYQAVSEKIPADMREEFEPYGLLAWAHYAFAARFPGREVEILSWAIENLASVDRLKVQFAATEGQVDVNAPPPTRLEYRTPGEMMDGIQMHVMRLLRDPRQTAKRAQARKLIRELRGLLA